MKETLNNIILVPTDFSEVCDNAIDHAAEAAKQLNYELQLLHVINKDTRAYLDKAKLSVDTITEQLEAKANEIRQLHHLQVKTIAKEGSIFKMIAEVALNQGANLIYLGTHGKVGMQKLTGSFALKVVLGSPVPVIVVQKRPYDKGYKHIVLPITSEAGPWEKTKWAVFISREFGATIHIYQINTSDDAVAEAAKIIGEYFKKNQVPYTYAISEKSSGFSKQVLDYAASIKADMIMIMTNPDQGFTKFLLGTYDEEMIFNAGQIPVMCINPRKFNYEILGI
jgi:nucleotide-binding universal stress UspA family protein